MKTKNGQSAFNTASALAVVRAEIEQQFPQLRAERPQFLRLALNEAEALAAQTGVPHLVFPALAVEKAQAAAAWHDRQNAVRHTPTLALAA